ncbi:MAG: molybdenum cofactor biosynthesis protein B [Arenicella sp.]
MSNDTDTAFIPLNIAILTVSDTRSIEDDTSGDYLISALQKDGHQLSERQIVKDDKYQLRAIVSQWVLDKNIHAIITTGGTGFTPRDNTPEALTPLFDKTIDGFGELFRQLSANIIGTSTIQSRCIAGLANNTLIACLPGSTGACKDAWKGILHEQLDSRYKPCNLTPHLLGTFAHK